MRVVTAISRVRWSTTRPVPRPTRRCWTSDWDSKTKYEWTAIIHWSTGMTWGWCRLIIVVSTGLMGSFVQLSLETVQLWIFLFPPCKYSLKIQMYLITYASSLTCRSFFNLIWITSKLNFNIKSVILYYHVQIRYAYSLQICVSRPQNANKVPAAQWVWMTTNAHTQIHVYKSYIYALCTHKLLCSSTTIVMLLCIQVSTFLLVNKWTSRENAEFEENTHL